MYKLIFLALLAACYVAGLPSRVWGFLRGFLSGLRGRAFVLLPVLIAAPLVRYAFRAWVFVIALLLMGAVGEARGQASPELKSLSEVFAGLGTSESDVLVATRYSACRCAALHAVVAGLMPSDSVGQDRERRFTKSAAALFAVATKTGMRIDPGAQFDDVLASVEKLSATIADLYRDRVRTNFAATGAYFMDDTLIVSDLKICKILAEEALYGAKGGAQ